MSEPGAGVLRPVQTFFEFIVAGTLILTALYGLVAVIDHRVAVNTAHAADSAARGVGVGSVLLVAAVYGIGVLIDDLTRLVLEERSLNAIKVARIEAFEQRHPGLIAQTIGLSTTTANQLTELQLFGLMRMYILEHSGQLYSEVTNQVARLRLVRVIVASLAVTLCAVGVLAVRTGGSLSIAAACITAFLLVGAARGMGARFDRYVRSVERAFLVLGAPTPLRDGADT
jgi:hypothetical protein